MGAWAKVGRVDEFREGRGRLVRVDGVAVAVFRVGDQLFALKDACPHMGASLADGKPEGLQVECHWHHWRFDLRTGKSTEREWARAATYRVRVEADEVWLEAPDPAPHREEEDEPEWIFWDAERYFKKPRAQSNRGPNREESAAQTDQKAEDGDQSDPFER